MIHIIQNNATRELVANGVLAYGGSSIMSEMPEEFEEIYCHVTCLVINLGMLTQEKIQVIHHACAFAHQKKIPIGIDPVGIHLSSWRRQLFFELIDQYHITFVRGNGDEIGSYLNKSQSLNGKSLESSQSLNPQKLIPSLINSKTIWLVSGATDWIVGLGLTQSSHGGSKRLRQISGAGCLLTALVAVNISKGYAPFEAAVLASKDMKDASSGFKHEGIGTIRIRLVDALEKYGGQNV